MTAVSRTAQFAKVHKVLKKHYKPVARRADRTVLEHLLFACCLEDARYEAAEEAFAALVHTFFDWNEVRVTSISRVVRGDGRPARPARGRPTASSACCTASSRPPTPSTWKTSGRRTSAPRSSGWRSSTARRSFAVAYVVQAALGGHSDPHRRRHDGRPAHPRPGDRQGRGRRRWCRGWSGPSPSRRGSSSARCCTSWGADSPPTPSLRPSATSSCRSSRRRRTASPSDAQRRRPGRNTLSPNRRRAPRRKSPRPGNMRKGNRPRPPTPPAAAGKKKAPAKAIEPPARAARRGAGEEKVLLRRTLQTQAAVE